MKKHKKQAKLLAKTQKKLRKAVRELSKASRAGNPAWFTALAVIAGAVATALSDGAKRERLKEIASDTTGKAVNLVTRRRKDHRAEDMPNGVVSEQRPGPV